jgi:PAS domain-containing protein
LLRHIPYLYASANITERKQLEKSLKDSEAFVLSVIDSLAEQIAVIDVAGTIIAVNAAWRRFAEQYQQDRDAEEGQTETEIEYPWFFCRRTNVRTCCHKILLREKCNRTVWIRSSRHPIERVKSAG